MEANLSSDKLGFGLKMAMFILLAVGGVMIFAPMLIPIAGYFIAAALGTFTAAAVANTASLRIFERARLADIGLNWHSGANRNLWIGIAAGVVASVAMVGPALLAGAARLEPAPDQPGSLSAALFVTVVLLFGAVGEEMLFRGYGFQLMLANVGRFGTILPTSFLFGIAHSANPGVTLLGIINTIGFGIVLGYAYTQSGDLWLPIGIHFGWNWTMPLFGLKLSGFTMSVTGYRLRWNVSDLWSGGDYGPEGSILTCAVVVGLMWFLHRAPVVTQVPYLVAKSARSPEGPY